MSGPPVPPSVTCTEPAPSKNTESPASPPFRITLAWGYTRSCDASSLRREAMSCSVRLEKRGCLHNQSRHGKDFMDALYLSLRFIILSSRPSSSACPCRSFVLPECGQNAYGQMPVLGNLAWRRNIPPCTVNANGAQRSAHARRPFRKIFAQRSRSLKAGCAVMSGAGDFQR